MDDILHDEHASRGPSGATEWGNCPAAPRLQSHFPERHSEFAELGTAAHSLLELCLNAGESPAEHRGKMMNTKNPVNDIGFVVDDNMIDAVQIAVEFIDSLTNSIGHLEPFLFYSERKIDPGMWTGRTDMWGTADVTIIAGDTIYILDYKHGQGVVVEIQDNWQLILYLIGVLADLPDEILVGLKTLVIGIIQPRAFHKDGKIRMQEIPLTDIPGWVEFFTMLANRTDDPEALPVPGDKQCRFCNAKPCSGMVTTLSTNLGLCSQPIMGYVTLEKVNQLSYEMEQAVSVNPSQLSPLQKRAWLDNANLIRACVDAIEAEATEELRKGTAPPEISSAYKLVNKDSRRKFSETDSEKLIKRFSGMGLKKDEITNVKVRTPNQIIAVAKKHEFSERKMVNLNNMIIKPPGALTIAPISDPRPAARETTAEEMFGAPETPAALP